MVEYKNILKLLLIVALSGFVIFKVFGYSSSGSLARAMMSTMKKNCNQSIKFYKKMEKCNAYKMDANDMVFEIVGLNSDGSCQVNMGSYNCNFPGSVYSWYALQNINYNKKLLKGIRRGSLNVSSDDKDWQSITHMTQQYCKVEYNTNSSY